MLRQFMGEGIQKVDAKGRVSIPATYRRVIEAADPKFDTKNPAEFVIVYGGETRDYLECFTVEGANAMSAQINALPRNSGVRKRLQKLFNGQSMLASIDETGRIVLPQKLRQKIGLEGEAYFIAMGETFNIWKPETYEAEEDDVADVDAMIPEGADEWALLDMVGEA